MIGLDHSKSMNVVFIKMRQSSDFEIVFHF
jgi:hypothetical protein